MALLRYVSHPEVHADPSVPVPGWELSERGRARALALLEQPWWADVVHLVASDETKARETAEIVAGRFGLRIDVRRDTGEIDRSATGYVPADRHEALADALFARPDESAEGWERAIDAQRRIRAAVDDLVADGIGDVAIIGHGGVGTLLWCDLSATSIDRRHDQPGQGHYWTYDRTVGRAVHPWWPIDRVAAR